LIRPVVTFSPTTPHHAAGSRTEPPVSVPIATGARPAATATPEPLDDAPGRLVCVPLPTAPGPAAPATPEPLDEPPGVRCTAGSHGLRGVPRWVLVPKLPIANSTVWVLPITIMPAALSRSV